ncbi:hypothetical protein Kpol_1050p116 [Vanderwaltozyma polyspora DSM 70294]|uniref:C2H2-type domain-containing protein n=1 Tax=Vanderwaltozyma polyspora (strain ATCC 22028 / DSM 70294 / BCRC 21397 / CBS 2163 / NBRC 10782 / NRRL Y-8283 / UCD 57-17) TaxID=436907 RepID=A7TF10_VANPO|nr:uncharacterized protein Kpol_1050p116 [Vanderwaltozyma polyspora DSM 70294]EDO19256.1 hypothetical protein Kpol_1050p116 [Vanderwaltozyma polyspora DSM 70294]
MSRNQNKHNKYQIEHSNMKKIHKNKNKNSNSILIDTKLPTLLPYFFSSNTMDYGINLILDKHSFKTNTLKIENYPSIGSEFDSVIMSNQWGNILRDNSICDKQEFPILKKCPVTLCHDHSSNNSKPLYSSREEVSKTSSLSNKNPVSFLSNFNKLKFHPISPPNESDDLILINNDIVRQEPLSNGISNRNQMGFENIVTPPLYLNESDDIISNTQSSIKEKPKKEKIILRKKRRYRKKTIIPEGFKSSRVSLLKGDIAERRKYYCRVCGKGLTTSGHLSRHYRIHTGEKKHCCPFEGCNQRFSRRDNCSQHYQTHRRNKSGINLLEIDL